MNSLSSRLERHPFRRSPHLTFLGLSLPVLLSLVAEPVTGLVDTAFVARLGASPLAALGVGTTVLSGVFWIFNFLGISTQTEVARLLGANRKKRAAETTGLALVLSLALGGGLTVVGVLSAGPLVAWMGAADETAHAAGLYLRIRLLGAPAVLLTTASFGALRGLQDMRTPLAVAAVINALNIVLDAILIFGWGPIPACGIAGAAWATVASHWWGALWAVRAVRHRLGFPSRLRGADAKQLFRVGRDLFVRTGLLTAFLVLATRSATRVGAEAGAAHQAIRQVWVFTALLLDAFAHTAQSLVGFFLGGMDVPQARRVARLACGWGLAVGIGLGGAMLALQGPVGRWLVPVSAMGLFSSSWFIASVTQPLNALTFVTDGIHWGTSDYRYLRNGMAVATLAGAGGLWLVDESVEGALVQVWAITGCWIAIRATLGMIRIWPGIRNAPLRP